MWVDKKYGGAINDKEKLKLCPDRGGKPEFG
jgi:hypothetical protein